MVGHFVRSYYWTRCTVSVYWSFSDWTLVHEQGGMSNEMYNVLARVTDGLYEGIAIGGDVYPGSTLSDHVLRFNNIPQVGLLINVQDPFYSIFCHVTSLLYVGFFWLEFEMVRIFLYADQNDCCSGRTGRKGRVLSGWRSEAGEGQQASCGLGEWHMCPPLQVRGPIWPCCKSVLNPSLPSYQLWKWGLSFELHLSRLRFPRFGCRVPKVVGMKSLLKQRIRLLLMLELLYLLLSKVWKPPSKLRMFHWYSPRTRTAFVSQDLICVIHNLIVWKHKIVKLRAQVEKKVITPVKDFNPPTVPEDLNAAIKSGKVRAPTHIVSTICDDRGTWKLHFSWIMLFWGLLEFIIHDFILFLRYSTFANCYFKSFAPACFLFTVLIKWSIARY